jgi:hypothetical protein
LQQIIIQWNQLAFLPGRSIHHTLLLCAEVLHDVIRTMDTPLVYLKVDFSKAYDKVQTVGLCFSFVCKVQPWAAVPRCPALVLELSLRPGITGLARTHRPFAHWFPVVTATTLVAIVGKFLTRSKLYRNGANCYRVLSSGISGCIKTPFASLLIVPLSLKWSYM